MQIFIFQVTNKVTGSERRITSRSYGSRRAYFESPETKQSSNSI